MKKGFTLIELLAVIVILAIILVIAVPQVMKVVSSVKINAYIANENMIIKSTNTYLSANVEKFPNNIGDTSEVSINELITNGYIKQIKDPSNRNNTCNGYILITKINNEEYDYIPHINCIDNTKTSSVLDGLVSDYRFDNNIIDYSMNSNDITTYGVTLSTDRFGITNKAMSFDGVDDYIDLNYGNALNPTTSPHTFLIWVKSNTTAPSQMFLSSSQVSTPNNRFYIGIQGGKWDMGIYTSGWGGGAVIVYTNWTFVAIVLDGTNAKYFINGVNIMTKSYLTYSFNRNIYLGNHDTSYFWNGKMDDLRIYNRALSEDEIKYLYDIEKY